VIFSPHLDEASAQAAARKYADLVKSQGGVVTKLDAWGKRKLAYPIKHNEEGYYFLIGFRAENPTLTELNRLLRIDESVLRHLIVRDELATGNEPALEAEGTPEGSAGKEEG